MDNNFYNDLIKTNKFCNEERNKIYIAKTKIMATDGYRAILLTNRKIPIEFQNKTINANFKSLERRGFLWNT